jgi:hypothetical protein
MSSPTSRSTRSRENALRINGGVSPREYEELRSSEAVECVEGAGSLSLIPVVDQSDFFGPPLVFLGYVGPLVAAFAQDSRLSNEG